MSFSRCQRMAASKGFILTRIKPIPYVYLLKMDRYQLETEEVTLLGTFKKEKL